MSVMEQAASRNVAPTQNGILTSLAQECMLQLTLFLSYADAESSDLCDDNTNIVSCINGERPIAILLVWLVDLFVRVLSHSIPFGRDTNDGAKTKAVHRVLLSTFCSPTLLRSLFTIIPLLAMKTSVVLPLLRQLASLALLPDVDLDCLCEAPVVGKEVIIAGVENAALSMLPRCLSFCKKVWYSLDLLLTCHVSLKFLSLPWFHSFPCYPQSCCCFYLE